MKTKRVKKIKVIQTQDPLQFQEEYNTILDELTEYSPEVMIQQFTGEHVAYIQYEETTRSFDCVSDEFHAEGIHYLCGQCPLHEPAEDGRQKHVWCKYADCGMTDIRREACEMFYTKVKQKEIKPIY